MQKSKIEWCDATWNPVPNHDGYYASADGRIMSMKRGSPFIMKQMAAKDGHLYVFMYGHGKMKKVWVHRAVLSAYRGHEEKDLECRHLDDDPTHNFVENLEWGDRLQNVGDKRRNGGMPVGEKSGTHKLTEQQVIEIRRLHGKESLRSIAKRYGVSHTCVRRAALGIKWGYIQQEGGDGT